MDVNSSTVQWSMLNQAEKNDQLNYSVYRCPDPVDVKTGEPWYTVSNVCPCDPNLSNKTGRGFTACPLGLSLEKGTNAPIAPLSQLPGQQPAPGQMTGALFNQHQAVPPQMWPRQLSRIGQQWRNAN